LNRIAAVGQCIAVAVDRRRHQSEAGEAPILSLPVADFGDGKLDEGTVRGHVFFPSDDQPLLFGEGQRAQQHRIHDAEDQRVRSNAQSERDHGDQAKMGLLQQHSRAEAQVLPECSHSRFQVSGFRFQVPGFRFQERDNATEFILTPDT